ncbi:hypothetical protein NDU88_002132 [Pleurodeles waltl]|uniref:Uncharacterized protein n=1 Tax=Pleurodeles waltl TaxID=8319 RepID=A0AAV7W250_PLEWA|nr:hypothetical protein NDU88_002132 [Pleurodeles waltl]
MRGHLESGIAHTPRTGRAQGLSRAAQDSQRVVSAVAHENVRGSCSAQLEGSAPHFFPPLCRAWGEKDCVLGGALMKHALPSARRAQAGTDFRSWSC